MAIFAVLGADSTSGSSKCLFLGAKDAPSAELAANKRGLFVSKCILLDKTRSRMSDSYLPVAAGLLRDAGEPKAALQTLQENNLVPTKGTLMGCRFIVPFLVSAKRTDLAWKLLQEAKMEGYSGDMCSHETELLTISRMEIDVLESDNKKTQINQWRTMLAFASPFESFYPPDDIDAYRMEVEVALDVEDGLSISQEELLKSVFRTYSQQGSLRAIIRAQELTMKLGV